LLVIAFAAMRRSAPGPLGACADCATQWMISHQRAIRSHSKFALADG